MKFIFIVNPISGKGKALDLVNNINSVCKKKNINYEIIYTTKPNDATNIAKRYKDEDVVLYSVGGDGTLNEIVNGVAGTNTKIGVIPGGSGNDFYKTIKEYEEINIKSDLGMINDTYFINIASLGIDSLINYNAIQLKNKVPASQIYNLSILFSLFKFKPLKLELEIDNKLIKANYTLICAANGRIYGGGFHIAPDALLDDNLFDIYIADDLTKFKIIKLLLLLIKKQHESSKNINKIKTNEIKISSEDDMIFQYDGEVYISKDVVIKISDNKVNIYNDVDFVNEILTYKR